MTTHPIGTNIGDITYFDRGTKVWFSCKEHPQYEYMSKQPSASQWFPANKATQDLQWGASDECPHTYPRDDVWVTTREYVDAAPQTVDQLPEGKALAGLCTTCGKQLYVGPLGPEHARFSDDRDHAATPKAGA